MACTFLLISGDRTSINYLARVPNLRLARPAENVDKAAMLIFSSGRTCDLNIVGDYFLFVSRPWAYFLNPKTVFILVVTLSFRWHVEHSPVLFSRYSSWGRAEICAKSCR